MQETWKNGRVWLVLLVMGALAAGALWPARVPVDVATIARGPLIVTIEEEGQTRVRDRFVVSAPVSGRVQRIAVEPGDTVAAGQVLTRMRPELAPPLDARTAAELRASLASAVAAVERARADLQRAADALAFATREHGRTRDLADAGLATRQALDARNAERQAAADAHDAASHVVEIAVAERQRLEARLRPAPAADDGGRPMIVTAPVGGVVLKRRRESESWVPAGDPLLEIGDPRRLEIVSDLLSTDAVKVAPGARVLIEQWGGDTVLEARVQRVEPSGFTKVSALGVEEQRVNVLCDLVDQARASTALGDGYRVDVRIVLWESGDVLVVPTSALFRNAAGQWAVYLVRDGRARPTPVTLGQRAAQMAEVRDGVTVGDTVVLYPGDALADGVRVAPRVPE